MNSFCKFFSKYSLNVFNFWEDNEYINCLISLKPSLSLISWSYSWCFDKAFWFFTAVNNSWKSLYSFRIGILVIRSWLNFTHWLHSIWVVGFFNFLHAFFTVMMRIFTPLSEFRTECSFSELLLWKATLFAAQLIVRLAAQSYNILRTILLPDCFIKSNWILFWYWLICMVISTVSLLTHSSLCFK